KRGYETLFHRSYAGLTGILFVLPPTLHGSSNVRPCPPSVSAASKMSIETPEHERYQAAPRPEIPEPMIAIRMETLRLFPPDSGMAAERFQYFGNIRPIELGRADGY